MSTHNRGTYWTFTIIGILTAAVLGYAGGRAQSQSGPIPNMLAEQPNVEADIFNQRITDANTLATPTENTEAEAVNTPINTFTGNVRSISDTTIELENPNTPVNGVSEYTFTLEGTTQYFKIDNVLIDSQVNYQTTTLSVDDIQVGDIVAVYTPEDIQTADSRFAASVELVAESPKTIQEQY